MGSDQKRKKDSTSEGDGGSERSREGAKGEEKKPKLDRRSKKIKQKRRRKEAMVSKDQLRASHILIKHKGSRGMASWKDPEGKFINSTTRDEAASQLKALRQDILSGRLNFGEAASRYSHCSSAKREGDLGPFGRGMMEGPFEEAAYALQVGEVSDIVDTDSGVHIIKRTG